MEMMSKHLLVILLPLVLSNILHMLIVKFNYYKWLSVPINTKLFGENKTWRGLLILPLANLLILFTIANFFTLDLKNPAFLGWVLGMAYILFELPNSLLKRKIGIKPGEASHRFKLLFLLLDKMDSAFGVCLVYHLMGFATARLAVVLFAICSVTHLLFSQLLVIINLKKSI